MQEWLITNDCLSLSCLETKADIPKGTLRHFIKERRNLPYIHYQSLKDVLYKYGFMELHNE